MITTSGRPLATASRRSPSLPRPGGRTTSTRRPGTLRAAAVPASASDRLRVLHARHHLALHNYLAKLLLGDVQLAEDLVQETFLRAWRHLSENDDVDLDAFRPWLYLVARRLVVDHLRARRVRPAETMVDDLANLSVAADPIGELLAAGAVRDALAQLRPEHLEVLVEIFFNGRTPTQVADRLGIPVGTVKSRTYYAKRALRAKLDCQE